MNLLMCKFETYATDKLHMDTYLPVEHMPFCVLIIRLRTILILNYKTTHF